jgi:membrane protein DedA with SNARE-associated domain
MAGAGPGLRPARPGVVGVRRLRLPGRDRPGPRWVLASEGRIALAAVLAAGIAGAAVGYGVGRRYGRRVLEGTLGRWINHEHFDRAERYLAARGGKAVFLSRFTAALRVLVPGLAGMAHMPYRTFAVFNIASAIGWGTLSVFLGFLGGRNWRHVASVSSHIGVAALGIVALAVVVGHLMRRRRARAAPVDFTGPSRPALPSAT